MKARVMKFSGFDPTTHLKIVTVAVLAAATVLLVGESGQLDRIASAASAPVATPLLQPTPQPLWRALPSRKLLMPAAIPQKSSSRSIG